LLLSAASQLAAFRGEEPPYGAIQRPGFDFHAPAYSNTYSGLHREYPELMGARYFAVNSQIPSQIILVGPQSGSTGFSSIDENNVQQAAVNFLSSVGLLPANCDLGLVSGRFVMGRLWFINLRKSVDGIPIFDAGIGMAISPYGKVISLCGDVGDFSLPQMNFTITENDALDIARAGILGQFIGAENTGRGILPLYYAEGKEFRPVYRFMIGGADPAAAWDVMVDAERGQIIQRTDMIHSDNISGTVSGSIQPLYPNDPWEDRNFFHLDLNFDGAEPVTTDMNGYYSLNLPGSDPVNASIYLRGPFMEVWNEAGIEAETSAVIDPPAIFDVYWDDSNSLPAERDGWYSAVFVHNWIKILDPGLTVMDFPMHCNVYIAETCNAFYSGWDRSINFYRAGGGCNNTAQIANVVYHEYGHAITDLQTRPNGPDGAMHEGFSDYLACTIMSDPLVGEGFYANNPNSYLRTLDNDNRYPDDWRGESHNDGLIIGGALWHTREDLSPHGHGYVDSLWHFARYSMPQDFETFFWAFVALDDDDGNIDNGTPNAYTIFENFGDRHGVGPGTEVTVTADTLLDSEDTTRSYTVSASVTSVFEANPDSILLYYDNGGGFAPLVMQANGSLWEATIPPQRNGTRVDYYILVVDLAGFRGAWPLGAPGSHYSFYVGPDIIPPTMRIVQGPPNTLNLLGPYGPFVINAYDVNGINSSQVRLHYYVNSEQEAVVPLSPGVNEGDYTIGSIDLDRQLLTGDSVHYYFTAVDDANIPNTGRLPQSGSFNVVMVTAEVIEYFERNGLDDWTCDEDWFLRNDGFYSLHSVWYASPNYPNNANSSMMSNLTFDFSPYRTARITFYYRGAIRANDSCLVEASNNNGQSWYRAGFVTDTVVSIFSLKQCDFSPILRNDAHQYRMRFRFVSDDSATWAGIMMDDIGFAVDPAVGVDNEAPVMPHALSLRQNFPNPFNPETIIYFELPANSHVRLEIFDILGRRISTLLDEEMLPGSYGIKWDGKDRQGEAVASGVYFYRIATDYGSRQEKMTLLR